MTTRQTVCLAAAFAGALALQPLVAAADVPTQILAGTNTGSADSFQGRHAWYAIVVPGAFRIAVAATGTAADSVPGFTPGMSVVAAFSPTAKGDRMTMSRVPNGLVYSGTAVKPTRVVLTVTPSTSTLVRQARSYTIEATGSVSFAGTSGADPVVGTYMLGAHGPAHFKSDGTIVASDGTQGTWVVFDPSLRLYTITLASMRYSLKLVPGRGLIDAQNGNGVFDAAK